MWPWQKVKSRTDISGHLTNCGNFWLLLPLFLLKWWQKMSNIFRKFQSFFNVSSKFFTISNSSFAKGVGTQSIYSKKPIGRPWVRLQFCPAVEQVRIHSLRFIPLRCVSKVLCHGSWAECLDLNSHVTHSRGWLVSFFQSQYWFWLL